jgi:hypothetical protein
MGFGGGGSGSFVLPNHLHTNGVADGGDLEELVSLIDGITFKAWLDAAIAASPATTQTVEKSGDFTTTSTSVVDFTGMSITMPNVTNGKYMLSCVLDWSRSIAGLCQWRFMEAATPKNYLSAYSSGGVIDFLISPMNLVGDLSGQIIKIQGFTQSGTLTIVGSGASYSNMQSLEINH